jgi:hypothetical protein
MDDSGITEKCYSASELVRFTAVDVAQSAGASHGSVC